MYQELLRRVKKSQNQNPVRNQGLGLSCLLLCLIVMLVLCILGHICSFSSIIEALLCGSTILWPPSKLKLFKFPLLFELLLQISLENFLFFKAGSLFPHFTHWKTYVKKNLRSNNFLEGLCDLSCCNNKGCSFYLYSKDIKVLKTK